jgi:hypothetical protein
MIIEHNATTAASIAPVWIRAVTANRGAVAWWNAGRRERGLNWLAFGLLLAAWNFSDNDAVITRAGRPSALAHHGVVTVRSARDLAN